jgi:hypothetical protein
MKYCPTGSCVTGLRDWTILVIPPAQPSTCWPCLARRYKSDSSRDLEVEERIITTGSSAKEEVERGMLVGPDGESDCVVDCGMGAVELC